MAPVRRAKKAPTQTSYRKVVLSYEGNKVVMRCPGSYEATIAAARTEFKFDAKATLALYIDMAALDEDSMTGVVRLAAGSWDLLEECAATPIIEIRKELAPAPKALGNADFPIVIIAASRLSRLIRVRLVDVNGRETVFLVEGSARIDQLRSHVARLLTRCPDNTMVRLSYDGNSLYPDDTFDLLDLEHNDIIEWRIEQIGGKPVIYLFSPTPLIATVVLALSPQWEFSALYPVVPVQQKQGQDSISWTVDVRPDGSLHDLRTGSDVTYLYWEATTCQPRPLSPPLDCAVAGSSSTVSSEVFQPAIPDIRPSNSVVLPVEEVPKYLDMALLAMTLHTEARTSFITYWLPAILRHKFIALRFLPQAAYEGAAPMDVTPAPDVVTRVFMLFRGIPKEDVDMWTFSSAERDPANWRDVVGVDTARATDEGLFRVLEWGGMEVN